MATLHIDSSVPTHRKFLKAGPAASWLWLCGVAYSKNALTDGFIPVEAVDYLGVKAPHLKLVQTLVDVKLWEPVDGGWRIHDYLEYNKSAAEVAELRTVKRSAGAIGGQTKAANRKQRAVADAKQAATAGSQQGAVADPQQARYPYAYTDANANAYTDAAASRARASPLVDQRHHRDHAQCGRVCLPSFLFNEFVKRRNHDQADQEIRDWALQVEQAWSMSPEEPGDPLQFWRARYDEKWPSTANRKTTPMFGTWKPQES